MSTEAKPLPAPYYAGFPSGRNPGESALPTRPRRALPPRPEDPSHRPAAEPGRDLVGKVLARISVDAAGIDAARRSAHANGTDLASELSAGGRFVAEEIAAAVAETLGLDCEAIGDRDRIVDADRRQVGGYPRMVKTCDAALRTKLFLLPRLEDLERTATLLSRHPEIARIARVTTPADVRRAFSREGVAQRVERACFALATAHPALSAHVVLKAAQAVLLTLTLGLSAAAFWLVPNAAALVLHAVAASFFAGCLSLRFLAALGAGPERQAPARAGRHVEVGPAETLPLYTVLVALYHEAGIVERLVESLRRLDWPASRLEIKLICESDDRPTQLAVERAIAGLSQFDLVVVPASAPRTKPKALNYALPLTAGTYLVLFDAEDDPDPDQLREAYANFQAAPDYVAGFQAPLVVRNGAESWLSGLFALEYAGLFRRMLPFLASRGLPLPLGGTSNHFDRAKLVEVGGWDPHNVTEDADLGMRFFRRGYRFGTLTRPTFEDAPERWSVWQRQRTRWNKGWFQTWLVHMREPALLVRQVGWRNTLVFQMLFAGMLLSALAHPIFIVLALSAFARIFVDGLPGGFGMFVLGVDVFNAVGGLASFVLLSYPALTCHERRTLVSAYAFLPVYWLLIAAATLRAATQLLTDPHGWEKTPHGLEARADMNDHRHRMEPRFE